MAIGSCKLRSPKSTSDECSLPPFGFLSSIKSIEINSSTAQQDGWAGPVSSKSSRRPPRPHYGFVIPQLGSFRRRCPVLLGPLRTLALISGDPAAQIDD
jgi:hypothetical protein